jgi:N-acetylglucosaminyl-diphospho-decaprenol L-rhamnosyltransferase
MSPGSPVVDLTVVIVSYNSEDVISGALELIVGIPGIEIIVVDNASIDSTITDIEVSFPAVRVMKMKQNLGFSRAVNLGIEASTSKNIMLLNPDAAIDASSIYQLLNECRADGVGIVAPLICDPGNRLQIVSAGHFPTAKRMFLHFTGLSRFSKQYMGLQGHYLLPFNLLSDNMDVEWVTGACMLFTKQTWERVGHLSERWFMYAEDIDFCYRVKSHGLSVRLMPKVEATHLVGQSDSTASFSANPAWILNLHDFYDAEFASNKIQSISWCIVVSAGLWSRSLLFRLRGLMGGRKAPNSWSSEANRFGVFAHAVTLRGLTLFVASCQRTEPRNEVVKMGAENV